MKAKFDDIRPYNDLEAQAALKRVAQSPDFKKLVEYSFPDADFETIQKDLSQVKSIQEFHDQFAYSFARKAINSSVDHLLLKGIEHIEKDKTFISVIYIIIIF